MVRHFVSAWVLIDHVLPEVVRPRGIKRCHRQRVFCTAPRANQLHEPCSLVTHRVGGRRGGAMGRGGAKRFKPGGYDSSCAPLLPPSPPWPRLLPTRARAWTSSAFLLPPPLTGSRTFGRGRYSTDGAMRDSNSQFSVSFYAKFFSCVICSLFIVGMAFYVMNSWLGVSGPPPRCTAPSPGTRAAFDVSR